MALTLLPFPRLFQNRKAPWWDVPSSRQLKTWKVSSLLGWGWEGLKLHPALSSCFGAVVAVPAPAGPASVPLFSPCISPPKQHDVIL